MLAAQGQQPGARGYLLKAIHLDPLDAAANCQSFTVDRQLGNTPEAKKKLATFNQTEQRKG